MLDISVLEVDSPGVRGDLLKGLALAAAGAAIQPFVVWLVGPFDESPWLVALVLLPLAVAVWVLGWPLYRDRRLLLGGGFLGFFLAYCLLFALAAGTDLLSGRRTELRGYDEVAPRNWLGLNRLGDWHYWLAPPAPAAGDLVIVTAPPLAGKTREEVRWQLAFLIHQAVARQAKGIAFDYYVEAESGIDFLLCRELDGARAADPPVPVLFGYRHEERNGGVERVPLPASLAGCLPQAQLGSLAGYREADNRVRMVPLHLRGDPDLETLSLAAAKRLARERPLALPRTGLVQFVPPRTAPLDLAGWPTAEDTERFRDRFVFVGSSPPGDVHETPFGELAGVRIHAYAAHALRSGAYLRRLARGWTFPILGALCYALTLIQARGGGRWTLLLAAVLLSTAVVLAAALAMRFGRVWVDVSYPLVGVWGLAGALSGGAALQAGRLRARPPAVPAGAAAAGRAAPADVFLSHNSEDKAVVRELARALQARGLSVWLDEWELVPGRRWQEALEEVIGTTRSAAVLVGPSGLGPWEIEEMRACLSQAVDRDLPVIPVLLPGAPERVDLPLFLRRFTWVDLRGGLRQAGLDRLEWGITGVKPKRAQAA